MPCGYRPAPLLCTLAALLALVACAAPPQGPARPGGTGMLRISSTPAGARIIVDDAPTNFRTPTAFPLPAGSHRVILSLLSHRNREIQVRVEAGATTQIEATLAALGSGSIGVVSSPPGAEIFVDGLSTGLATPADVRALPVGTHTIQLRRRGYEDWSQAVVVRQNRHFPFQALLVPSRRNTGTLAVRSQPPNALIAIDGAETDRITPASLAEVPAGTRFVELTLAGYRPWSGTVVIEEGRTRDLLVSLRGLPAQEAGSARVESDPPGAAITLNGILLRQKSPADLDGLPPGTFTIELARPGSLPWRGEFTVLPGERTLLQIKLEQAPPQPGRGEEGRSPGATPGPPHLKGD